MAAEWRQHEMPLEKVHLALSEPDVKELWNFLGNLVNINRMLQMALPPIETENTPKPEDMADEIAPDNGFMLEDPSINPDSAAAPSAVTAKVDTDASNDSRVASDARDGTVLLDNQVVFRTKNIIHSFSVNAGNRAIFAVGTSKEIYEIDVEVSSKYQKTSTALIPESKAPVDDLDGLPGRESLATLSLDDGDRLSATKRNLSFDSLQKALKKSMHTLRRGFSSTQAIDNGQRLQREGASVAIDSHPSLNYYLSPSSETSNSINLYHYGQKKELVSYTFKSAGRLTKIRFDPFGVRFGATDTKGDLHLWKFDASSQGLAPTQTLSCHNGPAYDFRYLSSGSFLATAGSSATSLNVCMWDTLLPQQKQRVKGFTVNEGGSHSLVYSPRHNLVISGGKRGDIAVIDVRQRICLNNYFAHDNTIRTLAIDEERDLLISGSASGEVKIWDLVSFQETHYWTPADPKGSTGSDRVGDPTCGILQLSVFDGWIYSCGIDGTLRRFTLDGSA
ncbi:WD40-repeat-containing domain protein [Polychytrium aggregatum]|uniref:WD40-repeat-containing domain protein n=1 Tax=Polychytrium aggregatum TaxID=110093 RepID=UPI0022FEF6B4|nr:WD40-repeat-containing domain protein [Polychytrium aggregatum]KAI9202400.1 WD40-repeat-containing domain protein [Polychytrium aggregatum]